MTTAAEVRCAGHVWNMFGAGCCHWQWHAGGGARPGLGQGVARGWGSLRRKWRRRRGGSPASPGRRSGRYAGPSGRLPCGRWPRWPGASFRFPACHRPGPGRTRPPAAPAVRCGAEWHSANPTRRGPPRPAPPRQGPGLSVASSSHSSRSDSGLTGPTRQDCPREETAFITLAAMRPRLRLWKAPPRHVAVPV